MFYLNLWATLDTASVKIDPVCLFMKSQRVSSGLMMSALEMAAHAVVGSKTPQQSPACGSVMRQRVSSHTHQWEGPSHGEDLQIPPQALHLGYSVASR